MVRSHHGSPFTSVNPFGQLRLAACGTEATVAGPSDEAFWQFEARIAVRAMVGIP